MQLNTGKQNPAQAKPTLMDKMLSPYLPASPSASPKGPANPRHKLQQAIKLQASEKFERAEKLYLELVAEHPADTRAMTLLASLYLHVMRFDDCLRMAKQSLEVDPNQADAHNIAGDAHYLTRRYELASHDYSRAAALNPKDAKANFDCGNALKMAGRDDEALASYRRAIELKLDYADAYHNCGVILREKNQFELALQYFSQAINYKPDYVEAYTNCGNTLTDMGEFGFALAHHNYAIELNPQYVQAHNGQGVALQRLRKTMESLDSFDKAISINPESSESYLNRGNSFMTLNFYEEARKDYETAISLMPENPRGYTNLGNLDGEEGRFEESLANYDKALQYDPRNQTALWNKALTKILLGDYQEGWQLYEHGWEAKNSPRGERRKCRQPLWLGDVPVEGKRVLLTAEQGFGDVIQFSRYALMVEALGAKVILEAPAPLMKLIQTMGPQFEVVERGQPYDHYDYYCPYMSLPLAFKTTVDTIPQFVPYLHVDKANIQQPEESPRHLKVGLVWSGSLTHTRDQKRSIPLSWFSSLLDLPVEFHCLQKEIRTEDMALLENDPRIALHMSDIRDFSDTASLIKAMDLVISVDTSVAHLAGALGKPVWVLLPKVPDYRWMLDREDSPWYPTARLFRQSGFSDWEEVMARVRMELEAAV